jgi:hypothetical protein
MAWVGVLHNELMHLILEQVRDIRHTSDFTERNIFRIARETCRLYFENKQIPAADCQSIQPKSARAQGQFAATAAAGAPDVALSADSVFYPSPLLQWYLDQLTDLADSEPSPSTFYSEISAMEDDASGVLYGDELDLFLAATSVASSSIYYWSDDDTWFGLEPELAELPWWANPFWRIGKADITGGVIGGIAGLGFGGIGAGPGATVGAGAASAAESLDAIWDCLNGNCY